MQTEQRRLTFGEWFREERTTRGMTQQKAAEKLGKSLGTIQNWERGFVVPDLGNLLKVGELFGLAFPFSDSEAKGRYLWSQIA